MIPNNIPDDDLKNAEFNIFKTSKDIYGCHTLKNSKDQNKRVIVKFPNQQHLQALLRDQNGKVATFECPH